MINFRCLRRLSWPLALISFPAGAAEGGPTGQVTNAESDISLPNASLTAAPQDVAENFSETTAPLSAVGKYVSADRSPVANPAPTLRGQASILVARNSIVLMEFSHGPLSIVTEGRAMSSGAAGDVVRVMNLNSKSIVAATVTGPSKVSVK